MLSKKEFDILVAIDEEKETLSQRDLAKITGYSVGTVNSTYAELLEKKLIEDDKVSATGYDAPLYANIDVA